MPANGAYRACPRCGTRNRHYMLVCTQCTRSLRGVPLVGTPPAGSVPVSGGGRRGLVALVVLAIAVGAALLAHRGLRSSPIEGDAAAASHPGGVKPLPTPAPDPGGWETLEQRFSALRPPVLEPAALPSPSAPETRAPAPAPPPATPSPLMVPASLPAPLPATARPPVRTVAPPPAPSADDPDRVLGERRDALRRAEDRLERLERRADDLRAQLEDEAARPEQREEWEAALARIRQRVEEAEREVVRAEWALSEVER